MRSKTLLRSARPVYVVGGAIMLAIPASAVALAAGQADAQSAIQITLTPRQAAFGHAVAVSGNATAAEAGKPLQLQFEPAASGGWQSAGSTEARSDGGFRFTLPAGRSGLLRVVPVRPGDLPRVAGGQSAASGGAAGISTTAAAPVDGGATVAASPTVPLAVSAQVQVPRRDLAVLSGQHGHVRGKLLPALAGRNVRLVTRAGRGWRTLATARTGPRGGFDLAVPANLSGRHYLRVSFTGDRSNRPTNALAGSVTTFTQSTASWYSDGGATACGFHAGLGVANKTLPCGTKVTFRYGGRTVTATVDDRGPYVGGREWDLNQNTAGALGFGGVDTVWASKL